MFSVFSIFFCQGGDQIHVSVLSCFHRIVEDLRSTGQLLEVLSADLALAQVVLTFLAQQTGEPGEPGEPGELSASKCLEGILRHPQWREEFEGFWVKSLVS